MFLAFIDCHSMVSYGIAGMARVSGGMFVTDATFQE
jgi:hypothetical protein